MKVAELKNNIILELFQKNLISIGEKIDYSKFFNLYSNYTYLPEYYFAKILGIDYTHFHTHFKNNKEKAIVLKNYDYTVLKQYCLSYLISNNLIKENSKINYQYFKNLLLRIPFINETILAEFLDIKISILQKMKYNQDIIVTILKNEFTLTDYEQNIINSLINNNIIYPGMRIDYSKLLKIHEECPNIDIERLAYMLEIKQTTFKKIKYSDKICIILSSKINNYILSQKDTIVNDLLLNKNATANEKIDYERFCELYKGYEYINEALFAEKILNLNYSNYMSLKVKGTKAVILKNSVNLTDEKCVEIFSFLLNEFNLKEGDKINYDTFKNMYILVANILTEQQLAEILGIEIRFDNIKYGNKVAIIRNGITLQKMYFISYLFNEPRFYSEGEINDIMEEYDVTLEDIITCFINQYKTFTTDEYINCYNTNKGLYIGKNRMSKAFFETNYKRIYNIAKNIVNYINGLGLNHPETKDMLQEIVTYIYLKCGDLEQNFGDGEQFYKKVFYRARKKFVGETYDNIFVSNNKIYNSISNQCHEDEIIESMSDNIYYKELFLLVQSRYNIEESIEYIAKKLNMDYDIVYQEVKKECELILNLKKDN